MASVSKGTIIGTGLASLLVVGIGLPAQASTRAGTDGTQTVATRVVENHDPIAVALHQEQAPYQALEFDVYVEGEHSGETIRVWYQQLDEEGYPVGNHYVLGKKTHEAGEFAQVIKSSKKLPVGSYAIQASIGDPGNIEWSYTLWIDVDWA